MIEAGQFEDLGVGIGFQRRPEGRKVQVGPNLLSTVARVAPSRVRTCRMIRSFNAPVSSLPSQSPSRRAGGPRLGGPDAGSPPSAAVETTTPRTIASVPQASFTTSRTFRPPALRMPRTLIRQP